MHARHHTPIALLVTASLLAAASIVNRRLQSPRMESAAQGTGLAGCPAPSPGTIETPIHIPASPMPPGVAFATVFLGGFRGLIADGLWIRAAMLQEQGRYFEIVQLADWITALEPQFPQVWAYQAWNMAYNVSVLMPDREGRWNWVRNGLELLRDRGLATTGFSPEICLEIGLLFQHKIGGAGDDHADYFKQRWAEQMHAFMGEDGRLDPEKANLTLATLKLDYATVQLAESRFGNLDWRLAGSHAVFWALKGLRQGATNGTAIACQRMIYQSMAALFESGSLTADRDAGVMVFSPAFDLLPGVLHAFETAITDDPVAAEGFANWLSRAIRLLMFYQRREEAEPLFRMLHSRFPSLETEAGFETFILRRQTFLPKVINTKP